MVGLKRISPEPFFCTFVKRRRLRVGRNFYMGCNKGCKGIINTNAKHLESSV